MTRPQDAQLLAALEAQHRELTALLARLQRARRQLVPPPATFWRGAARNMYDSALDALDGTVNASVITAQSARDRTATAISQVVSRA